MGNWRYRTTANRKVTCLLMLKSRFHPGTYITGEKVGSFLERSSPLWLTACIHGLTLDYDLELELMGLYRFNLHVLTDHECSGTAQGYRVQFHVVAKARVSQAKT